MNDHQTLLAELAAIRAAASRLTASDPPDTKRSPLPSGTPSAGDGDRDREKGDPEVTVAMPARETAPFVAEAVASVLRQEGVRLELVVVDDASTDATADIVSSIRDPRIRLLRNDRRRGIGHGHNRVVAVARTPFIAHVDADDVILQGALRAALDALRAEPEAGQAYCDHVAVGADGVIAREDFEAQRAFLETQRRDHPDVCRGLLRHGMVTNALRTYRREVLEETGPFAEDLAFAVDWEMSVRIAERHAMILVPRLLYVRRLHPGSTQATMPFRALRSWGVRRRIVERLLGERGGRLLGYDRIEARLLVLGGLGDALGLGRAKSAIRRLIAP